MAEKSNEFCIETQRMIVIEEFHTFDIPSFLGHYISLYSINEQMVWKSIINT